MIIIKKKIIHKDGLQYEYKNKKEALVALHKAGEDPKNYEFLYAYRGMARKPYSSGYAEAHRRAARAYRERNGLNTGNPRGRPRKDSTTSK